MTKLLSLVGAAVAVSFMIATTAEAQTQVSGGGLAMYVPHGSTVSENADGGTTARWAVRGFVTADDKDDPLYMINFDCTGLTVTGTDGSVAASGLCNGIDDDDDTYSLWWRGGAEGGEWEYFAGTGKFDGMVGGGTYSNVHTWGDGKYIVRYDGTWTMQ